MKYAQLNSLKDWLANSQYKLIDDGSEVQAISVERQQFLRCFHYPHSTSPPPINANACGSILYAVDEQDLVISLQWQFDDISYHGPRGISHDHKEPQLLLVNLYHSNGEPLRIMHGKTKVLDQQLQPMLRHIFTQRLQSWKAIPGCLINGFQPTHLRSIEANGLVRMESISDYSADTIKKITRMQPPKQIANYYDHAFIDDNHAFMRGFSCFSLSEKEAMFVSIHWLIRAPAQLDNNENLIISLIETSQVPPFIVSGFDTMRDPEIQIINDDKDVMFVLQFFQLDRNWGLQPIHLFRQWLKKQLDMSKQPDHKEQKLPVKPEQDEQSKNARLRRIAANASLQKDLFIESSKFSNHQIELSNNDIIEFEAKHITTYRQKKSTQDKNEYYVYNLYQDRHGVWICTVNIYEQDSKQASYCGLQKWSDASEIKGFLGKAKIPDNIIAVIRNHSKPC